MLLRLSRSVLEQHVLPGLFLEEVIQLALVCRGFLFSLTVKPTFLNLNKTRLEVLRLIATTSRISFSQLRTLITDVSETRTELVESILRRAPRLGALDLFVRGPGVCLPVLTGLPLTEVAVKSDYLFESAPQPVEGVEQGILCFLPRTLLVLTLKLPRVELEKVPGLPRLEHLAVSGEVTGLKDFLARCPKVTACCADELPYSPTLRHVSCNEAPNSNLPFAHNQLKSLEVFSLVSRTGFPALLSQQPDLERLEVHYLSDGLTQADFAALAAHRRLRTLLLFSAFWQTDMVSLPATLHSLDLRLDSDSASPTALDLRNLPLLESCTLRSVGTRILRLPNQVKTLQLEGVACDDTVFTRLQLPDQLQDLRLEYTAKSSPRYEPDEPVYLPHLVRLAVDQVYFTGCWDSKPYGNEAWLVFVFQALDPGHLVALTVCAHVSPNSYRVIEPYCAEVEELDMWQPDVYFVSRLPSLRRLRVRNEVEFELPHEVVSRLTFLRVGTQVVKPRASVSV